MDHIHLAQDGVQLQALVKVCEGFVKGGIFERFKWILASLERFCFMQSRPAKFRKLTFCRKQKDDMFFLRINTHLNYPKVQCCFLWVNRASVFFPITFCLWQWPARFQARGMLDRSISGGRHQIPIPGIHYACVSELHCPSKCRPAAPSTYLRIHCFGINSQSHQAALCTKVKELNDFTNFISYMSFTKDTPPIQCSDTQKKVLLKVIIRWT